MHEPYVSCIIDNFQSIGCDIEDLTNDPTFLQLKNSKLEFQHPNAYWSVQRRIGNGVVSLWIKEQHKDSLAELNEWTCSALGLPQSALRVACTVVKKNRRGRLNHESAIKVWLTPDIKVSPPPAQQPHRGTQPAPSPSFPSRTQPTGSYAMKLAEGIRRSQERNPQSPMQASSSQISKAAKPAQPPMQQQGRQGQQQQQEEHQRRQQHQGQPRHQETARQDPWSSSRHAQRVARRTGHTLQFIPLTQRLFIPALPSAGEKVGRH